MPWLLFLLIPLGLTVFFLVLSYSFKARGERLKADIRRQYGDGVRLITGCGIVRPPNRVPGILALTEDRLVCRSLIGWAVSDEEIPLASVERITWEETRKSVHRMARKYRRALVLGVTDGTGVSHVFVLAKKDAGVWQEALPER
jgi:hypothetical protein